MLLQGISLPSPLGEGLGVRPVGGVFPFIYICLFYIPTAFSHHFSLTLQLLSGLFAAVYADGVFWITNETKQKNKDEKDVEKLKH